ncbi:MAG: nucleotidyl transferase AbiEii/AbiGii toxin family protein [Armatimonadetes bacterium]|nr:nucleotidyl transferase AbiEii/AbiGii toxin family protein [Armatimonadota bacterium]
MIHIEVLEEHQIALLPSLASFVSKEGFYLGGGTAIALQLGHRKSADFDFFSEESIQDPLSLARQAVTSGINFTQTEVSRGTLHTFADGVRVSFFEYRYPLLSNFVQWPEYGLRIASLDDLACMKLAAIAQRGARKDFVDVYALGSQYTSLSKMLDLYQYKYATDEIAHVLVGLTYFDDADEEPMPIMLWDVSWEEMKHSIRIWVKEFVH